MNAEYQDCPLCGHEKLEVFYVKRDGGKRKIFDCPMCKLFIITDSAEKVLKTFPDSRKAEISDYCKKVGTENLLHIFVPPIESKKPIELQIEPRSKWDLS